MNNTGIIILAAGNSSRFGGVKQLLHFNNKTLLQHVIEEACASGAKPVIVITGAHQENISKDIYETQAQIFHNKNWKNGIASSIVAGVQKTVTSNNDIENIIIAVCDQPFVLAEIFKQLYQTQKKSVKHIVASSYADTIGTPVLFTQKYFNALMNLTGDEGAKKLLKANLKDIVSIDFPQGAIDIDTQKDYEDLLDSQQQVF